MPNPTPLPSDFSSASHQLLIAIIDQHSRRATGLQDLMGRVEERVSALEKLVRDGGGSEAVKWRGESGVRVTIKNKRGEVFFRPQGALAAVSEASPGLDIHVKNRDGNVYFEPGSPLLTTTTASSSGFWDTGRWAKVLVLAGVLYYYRCEVSIVGRGVVAGVRVAVERVGRMGGRNEEEDKGGQHQEKAKRSETMSKETQEEDEQQEKAQKDDKKLKQEEQKNTELKDTETNQQQTIAPNPPAHPAATQPRIPNKYETQTNRSIKKPAIIFYGDLAQKPKHTPESDVASAHAMRSAMEVHQKFASTQTDPMFQPQPQPESCGFPSGSQLSSHWYPRKGMFAYPARVDARPETNSTPASVSASESVLAYAASSSAAVRPLSIHRNWTSAPHVQAQRETNPAPAPIYYARNMANAARMAPPADPPPSTPNSILPQQQETPASELLYSQYMAETWERKMQRQFDQAAVAMAAACAAGDAEGRAFSCLEDSLGRRVGRGTEGFVRAVEEALREGEDEDDEDSEEEEEDGDDEEDSDEDEDEEEDYDNDVGDEERSSCVTPLTASMASGDDTISEDPIFTPNSSSDSMHDDTEGYVEEHAWLDEPIVDMSNKLVFCAGWPVVGYGNGSKC